MSELTFRPITAADETDFYAMAEEFFHLMRCCTPFPQSITGGRLRR